MRLPALLCALLVSLATPAAAQDQWSDPFPGGRHLHRTGGGQDLHVLLVDLCAPGVRVRGTRRGERGRVVSSFGGLVGAAAAINGDFFNGSFDTDGPSAGDGERWGGGDHGYVAPVSFGRNTVEIPHHNNEGGPPGWAEQVVSGHPTLLDDGAVVGNPGDPLCTNRHPRTALGLTADHRTLVLLVVDGRRGGAAGMTCPEMPGVLAEFGAFDALNLDGGGSSTLWLANGGVQNRPSDGRERTVGNHLAVIVDGGRSPHCPTPAWRGEFVGQSHPLAHVGALELHEGQTADGWIELRNTGRETWNGNTHLAPIPRDQPSPLFAETWIAPHRVSSPLAETPPGEVGRFPLPLTGRSQGEFTLKFGLVQEGVTWFADDGGPSDDLMTIRANVGPAPPPDAAVAPPLDVPGTAKDANPHADLADTTHPPDATGAASTDGAPRPDVAPGDPAPATDDATTATDAALASETGDPGPVTSATVGSDFDGGCQQSGPRSGFPLLFALLALLPRRIRRRRRH